MDYESTPQEALRDRAESAQSTAKAVVRSLRYPLFSVYVVHGCGRCVLKSSAQLILKLALARVHRVRKPGVRRQAAPTTLFAVPLWASAVLCALNVLGSCRPCQLLCGPVLPCAVTP